MSDAAVLGTKIRRVARRLSPTAQCAAWRVEGNLRNLEKGVVPSMRGVLLTLIKNDLALIETERTRLTKGEAK